MPTPSYLIAQQVIPQVKAKCPRIMQIAQGKNSFTFFAGSAYEQTVQFCRMMAHANPFWESPGYADVRSWKTRINVSWLTDAYNNVLLDEIYTVMGIQAGTSRYAMEDDLLEIVGRAMQIAKIRIWGIPIGQQAETWFFHRIITGCAKKTVPEAVWKIACTNAGGLYGVNENVLMDAILERKAYQSLYAIHPLLGRSWVPWIRKFVEQITGNQAEFPHYAKQLQSALNAHGIHKSGVKTLHRMAETSPMTFRNVMRHLVNTSGLEDASPELAAMLNLFNGQKPTSGVTFSNIVKEVMEYQHGVPARHLEDIRILVQIDHWLAKDMRFDRQMVYDWMRFLVRERRGSLHRGYLDVMKDIKSPAKRKEAALTWANRSQQYWHRHRPQEENIFQISPRPALSWKPILDGPYRVVLRTARTPWQGSGNPAGCNPVFRMDVSGLQWQFVELTSSAALREEGDAMRHCVAGYDGDCHRGQSHIFSVRDAKGRRVSTLELRVKTRNGQYVIHQNRGTQNAAVSTACRVAANSFLKMVNDFLKATAKRSQKASA